MPIESSEQEHHDDPDGTKNCGHFPLVLNLQILSPATLGGSWEMRQFIVPLGILIAAKELDVSRMS